MKRINAIIRVRISETKVVIHITLYPIIGINTARITGRSITPLIRTSVMALIGVIRAAKHLETTILSPAKRNEGENLLRIIP